MFEEKLATEHDDVSSDSDSSTSSDSSDSDEPRKNRTPEEIERRNQKKKLKKLQKKLRKSRKMVKKARKKRAKADKRLKKSIAKRDKALAALNDHKAKLKKPASNKEPSRIQLVSEEKIEENPAQASFKYEEHLATLHEMGFINTDVNKKLLIEHGGNVNAVFEVLIAAKNTKY